MMLADFTTYSMPSSSGTTGSGGEQIPGGKQRSSIISAWITQLRKRKKKKRKKKVADQFDLHHYPDQREKRISYSSDKRQDGNIEWRRRYERFGDARDARDRRRRGPHRNGERCGEWPRG